MPATKKRLKRIPKGYPSGYIINNAGKDVADFASLETIFRSPSKLKKPAIAGFFWFNCFEYILLIAVPI